MSTIEAYDLKARKKVIIQNPQPYQMNNGMWAVKGTSPETGTKVYRIVGRDKPSVSNPRFAALKRLFTSRECECSKSC